jgi:hypothetical protein
MTDMNVIGERLRRFVAAEDDSDWQDVLRRARDNRRTLFRSVTGVPALVPQWSRQGARRRRIVGLSTAAAVVVATGVVVGLLVTAASPPNAYAAAKRAVADTAAVSSGTMTISAGASSSIADAASTLATVRWNGKDVAIASGADGNVLRGFDQLLLVGGGVYLQRADGSWLHYASEAELVSSLLSGTVLAADSLALGGRAVQIIASAYGLQKTEQADGSTVYSGTIPPSAPAKVPPSKDTGRIIMDSAQLMLPSFGSGGDFQMVVGSDGLVRQMSETAAPPLTGAWSIKYTGLGDSPPITPPATYTEGTAADLPTQ